MSRLYDKWKIHETDATDIQPRVQTCSSLEGDRTGPVVLPSSARSWHSGHTDPQLEESHCSRWHSPGRNRPEPFGGGGTQAFTRTKSPTQDGKRNFKKSECLLCQSKHLKLKFIAAHRKCWPITILCRVREVTAAGLLPVAWAQAFAGTAETTENRDRDQSDS